MNKQEIEKQNKELKQEIRELRKTVKELGERAEKRQEEISELPVDGFTFYRNSSNQIHIVRLNFDPETKEIVMLENRDLGKDLAIGSHKIKQLVAYLLTGSRNWKNGSIRNTFNDNKVEEKK